MTYIIRHLSTTYLPISGKYFRKWVLLLGQMAIWRSGMNYFLNLRQILVSENNAVRPSTSKNKAVRPSTSKNNMVKPSTGKNNTVKPSTTQNNTVRPSTT